MHWGGLVPKLKLICCIDLHIPNIDCGIWQSLDLNPHSSNFLHGFLSMRWFRMNGFHYVARFNKPNKNQREVEVCWNVVFYIWAYSITWWSPLAQSGPPFLLWRELFKETSQTKSFKEWMTNKYLRNNYINSIWTSNITKYGIFLINQWNITWGDIIVFRITIFSPLYIFIYILYILTTMLLSQYIKGIMLYYSMITAW